jgi:hypothetical protein
VRCRANEASVNVDKATSGPPLHDIIAVLIQQQCRYVWLKVAAYKRHFFQRSGAVSDGDVSCWPILSILNKHNSVESVSTESAKASEAPTFGRPRCHSCGTQSMPNAAQSAPRGPASLERSSARTASERWLQDLVGRSTRKRAQTHCCQYNPQRPAQRLPVDRPRPRPPRRGSVPRCPFACAAPAETAPRGSASCCRRSPR